MASVESEGSLTLTVNDHTLTGQKRDGEWTFRCDSWPDIAEKWNGDTISGNAIEDFMNRVLAGAVRIKQLFQQ